MKLISLILISLFFFHKVNAQLTDNTPFAKTIDLKDENHKVIALMSIDPPGVGAKICLAHFSQSQDSTGLYISEYRFMRPNHLEADNITIILQFSRRYENVYFDTKGEADNVRTTTGGNNGMSFQASRLSPDGVIIIKVMSKTPTLATISGIAGQIWVDK